VSIRVERPSVFIRFFFDSLLSKKVERFPAWTTIQDTNEPSSDRLIEEGRPLLRRLSYFYVHTTAGYKIAMGGHPLFGG
jgi:hypothetical protein